jgi:ATP-dependent Clp protease ATP-binding subunit ClpA
MEKLVYPLLHYPLSDEQILGVLVGTDYQLVDSDLRRLKSQLTTHLKRNYKKYDDYPYLPLESFQLKTFYIKVRPVYKEQNRSFPSKTTIEVPVDAVYGPTDQGQYCCYLPLFEENFYYYDPKLLPALVKNFSSNLFSRRTPDALYRMVLSQRPTLDEISLKVNYARDYSFNNGWEGQEKFDALEALAERYPMTKKLRQNIAAFPEAAWELEQQVDETIDKIVSTRSNVLLVGKHGTGKSAVLRQAIKKIAHKKSKINLTFWQLVAQRITARAKYLGEWQQQVEQLVYELERANGILWVLDVVQLLQTGGEGPEDSVAAFLTSFLQAGKLQLLGEVTPSQLESMRRLLPGFVENFQLIQLEEMPEYQVQKILDKLADYCQQNLKIELTKSARTLSYRLLRRYYSYESFPGKAIKFLGQCISKAQKDSSPKVDKTAIVENFVTQTGMPELFLRDDLLLNPVELSQYFEGKIIGQGAAIEALCNVVKIFKAGLNSPGKPIATMIFAGPTGVGKTASTKALAAYFFGKGQKKSPLIRLDMSEFQHPAQLARFIGAGGDVGKLVQEIRERPFSVLLLDEIEKADPSIFDALLTVLDEGLLVDAYGRVTNFRNTIIIMTSNLGASNRASIGFGNGNPPNYESAIGQFFRPEFVNRIDHIVLFDALKQQDIRAITRLELAALEQREGFDKRGIRLVFSERLEAYLAETGFDERYGARPLQRTLEYEIIAPVAKWLLAHPNTNHTTLRLDREEHQLTIKL